MEHQSYLLCLAEAHCVCLPFSRIAGLRLSDNYCTPDAAMR